LAEIAQIGCGVVTVAASRPAPPKSVEQSHLGPTPFPVFTSFDSARAAGRKVCDELHART
jgi:hypothetical protein